MTYKYRTRIVYPNIYEKVGEDVILVEWRPKKSQVFEKLYLYKANTRHIYWQLSFVEYAIIKMNEYRRNFEKWNNKK